MQREQRAPPHRRPLCSNICSMNERGPTISSVLITTTWRHGLQLSNGLFGVAVDGRRRHRRRGRCALSQTRTGSQDSLATLPVIRCRPSVVWTTPASVVGHLCASRALRSCVSQPCAMRCAPGVSCEHIIVPSPLSEYPLSNGSQALRSGYSPRARILSEYDLPIRHSLDCPAADSPLEAQLPSSIQWTSAPSASTWRSSPHAHPAQHRCRAIARHRERDGKLDCLCSKAAENRQPLLAQ